MLRHGGGANVHGRDQLGINVRSLIEFLVDNSTCRGVYRRPRIRAGISDSGFFAKGDTMRHVDLRKLPRAGPGFSVRNVSRRQFVGISAGAAGAGAVLGSGLWTPARGEQEQDDRDERDEREKGRQLCPEQDPIPHINMGPPSGIGGFRFFFPGPVDGSPAATDPEPAAAHAAGRDPSLIFNFDGVVGQADLILAGTGTDTTTGASAR